jgi:cytochrome oxidase Cu insertion factor (SCO1/SenC/PrrC family)
MKNRLLRIVVGTLAGLFIAAGIAWWQISNLPGGPESTTRTGTATIGGSFELVDQTGRTVTDVDFRGKLMLIYFGYTFCPDVCPTELQAVAGTMDALGPDADRVQPIFITVDPERDTVPAMAEYVALFHPRMVGLTGTTEKVAAAARAYRVYYAKAKSKDDESFYTMDHSSFIYLMGTDGRFLEAFGHGTPPDRMAEAIRRHSGG